jgi:parvulin-like peptidyl-prolyl isomerase
VSNLSSPLLSRPLGALLLFYRIRSLNRTTFVARTFYSVVLCLTLAMLAIMWLRPGLAQDILDMCTSVVRAQSPDYRSQSLPFGNTPYDNQPGNPAQPMPVSRPVGWPGTPVNNNVGVTGGGPISTNSGAQSPYTMPPASALQQGGAMPPAGTMPPNGAAMPARSGVTVWDPSGNYQAAPPASAMPAMNPPASAAASPGLAAAALYGQMPPPTSTAGAFPAMPAQAQPYPQTQPYPAQQPYPAAAPQQQPYPATPYQQAAPAYPQATPYQQVAPYQSTPDPAAAQVQQQPYGAAPQQYNPMRTDVGGQPVDPQNLLRPDPYPPQQPQPQNPPPLGSPAQPGVAAPNAQVLPGPPQEMPETAIAAKVGTEAILMSDVHAMIFDFIKQKKLEIPQEQMKDFMAMAERPLLKQLVEMKLIYNDAMHNIPAEGLKKVQGNINDVFDKEQLPKLMKDNDVSAKQDLDAKLRQRGSSLEYERRSFFEKNMYAGWMQEKIKRDPEVPLADILGKYEQNSKSYEFPAKARFEELMVSFSQYPDKSAAFAALAEMGNQVMQGANFAELAKAKSNGPTAPSGGVYDWTTQGSLSAKVLDAQVFSLPPNRLSQIIESDRGFHIVRVLARKEAGRTSFADAQGEIKRKMKDEIRDRDIKKYLDELKMKTPVWTIYDDKPGGLEGLPQKRESDF